VLWTISPGPAALLTMNRTLGVLQLVASAGNTVETWFLRTSTTIKS